MKNLLFITFFLSACVSAEGVSPEDKLRELNLKIPAVVTPMGNYVDLVQDGDILYLSGKGPSLGDGSYIKGKLGKDLSVREGQTAAQATALVLIAVLKQHLGDLNRVTKIIKLNAAINSTEAFDKHPAVVDGASNLIVEVFGAEIGKHPRTAIGVNSLPMGIPIEIDLIVKIKK